MFLKDIARAAGHRFHLSHGARTRLCRFAQSIEHGGGTMVGVEFLTRGAVNITSSTFWVVGVVLISLVYLITDGDQVT